MTPPQRKEVLLLGFGEPEVPSAEATTAYLERIFRSNARLDGDVTPDEADRRARELAERRMPGLLEDYRRIGGSPLLAQCRAQAEALATELRRRGHEITVRTAMQFTAPFVPDVAAESIAAGTTRIVAVPLYPLCGHSTTVAALDALESALAAAYGGDTGPSVVAITGWHAHPRFLDDVADSVRAAVAAARVSLDGDATRLYFSAHGTPVRYLEEGSRYDAYVREACRLVAERLDVGSFEIGFQNHANRGIPWTEPANEDLVPTLKAERLVVVPISFVHEQSETLVELDEDFREMAAAHGMDVIRVPVPYLGEGLISALADVVEPCLDEDGEPDAVRPAGLRPCRCRPRAGTWCLNGERPMGADRPASESRAG